MPLNGIVSLSGVPSLGPISCSWSHWNVYHTPCAMGTEAALGTVRDAVKTQETTGRLSSPPVKTKLPTRISLQMVTSPPDPTLTPGTRRPKKGLTNVANCIWICVAVTTHWERTYYVPSTDVFALLPFYLTYFSLCSIFMVYIKHMFLDSRNGLFKYPGALYLQFW